MILKYFKPTQVAGGNFVYMTNTEIKAFIEEKHHSIRLNPYKLGLTLKKLGFEKISKRVDGSAPKIVYLLEYL